MRTVLFFCGLLIFCCGVLAQKPKEDVHEIIRQELEAKRAEVTVWKERWAREYEAKKGVEVQLSQLRAAVAKAAKL